MGVLNVYNFLSGWLVSDQFFRFRDYLALTLQVSLQISLYLATVNFLMEG